MPDLLTTRTVTINGPAVPLMSTGEPVLQLRSMHGSETLSEIYTYTLDCVTSRDLQNNDEAADLDVDAMIGKELTISIQLEGMGTFVPGMPGTSGAANIGAGVREISGIVMQVSFLGRKDATGQCWYRLTLQPWVVLADHQSDYRIFQNQSVVEIIGEVLHAYSYTWEKRLSGTYPRLVYQVQYGETDFAFLQRLMAEWGIYWFFEHSGGFHRLVLVDHVGAHRKVDSEAYHTLWYHPRDHKIDREYIDSFQTISSFQSGRWATSDFDFENPAAQLDAIQTLPQDTAHNQLERYEWPGDYTDPAQGEYFALVRMQELYAQGKRATGSGNLRDVVCGATFTLANYPKRDANREYLVLSASLKAFETDDATGSGSGFKFRSSFVLQPATVAYRAPRKYPKPRTTGPQTATVTGPEGLDIWSDQYGRVKLKFHWDRSPICDQGSSCWVRVSYPGARSGYGSISIPRVGGEVIVDFEHGDPDRPIVVGQAYNAINMPPWNLPGNATQSGLLTRSIDGGAADNLLRFEDKKGAEEIFLHAGKDLLTQVKNNETHRVDADRTRSVGGNESVSVSGMRAAKVMQDEAIDIGGNQQTSITGNQLHKVQNNRDRSVGGNDSADIGGDKQTTISGNYLRKVERNDNKTIGGDHNLSVRDNHIVKVGRDMTITAGQTVTYSADESLTFECGKTKFILKKNGDVFIVGKVQFSE